MFHIVASLLHIFSYAALFLEFKFLDQSHNYYKTFDSMNNYGPYLDRIWENTYILNTGCMHGQLEFVN